MHIKKDPRYRSEPVQCVAKGKQAAIKGHCAGVQVLSKLPRLYTNACLELRFN